MENNTNDETEMSLSEMVERYNNAFEDMPSYHSIERRIMEMGYQLPQYYFNLDEEDASEFLLFLHSQIPSIISKYTITRGEFEHYFFAVLKTQIKAFTRYRSTESAKHNAFVHASCTDDQILCTSKRGFEIQSDASVRLSYVVNHSYPVRKRFFVMIVSLSPYLSVDEIDDLCSVFRIDLLETLIFTSAVSGLCQKDLAELDELRSQRSAYYAQYLSKCLDHVMDEADRKLYHMNRKNSQIAGVQKRARCSAVAKVLGVPEGTVANCLFKARNLLKFVLSPNDETLTSKDLSIKRDLFENLRNLSAGCLPTGGFVRKNYHPLEDFSNPLKN